MKPANTLRNYDLRADALNMFTKYLPEKDFDFDVFLPSKGMNLQRPFVWTNEQKEELIMSLFVDRYVPAIYLLCMWNEKDRWEVIDGKQRLGAIIGFLKDEFPVHFEGNPYLFSELPEDYQRLFFSIAPQFRVIYEGPNKTFTDEQKIQWFRFINFAGTPQEKDHMDKLLK